MCEEFHCRPTEAEHELVTDPEHRAVRILELRDYARAKAALASARNDAEAPTGPMVDWVKRVLVERIRERMRRG